MVYERIKEYVVGSSIFKKLLFWLVFTTFLVMIIFGFFSYMLSINQLNKNLEVSLEEDFEVLGEVLKLHIWNLDKTSVVRIIESQELARSLRFLQVYNNFGDLMYEKNELEDDKNYIFKKGDVFYDGKNAGSIEIASSKDYIEVAKVAVIKSTLAIVFSVFFTVLIISFFISRSISKPIVKISEAAEEIAKGNLNKKVEVPTRDEVGRLGKLFNIMTDKLKKSYHSLEDKVKERTAELEKERSAAVKREKNMAEMRTATLSILEDVEATRKELAKSNKLKDLFMDIMRHDLLNPAGVVKMNSQLALEEEKDVKKKEVLEAIERNSNRMIKMIENASLLAKLESGEKINFRGEDLGVMLKGSVEELCERAKEKEINIRVFAEGKFPVVVNPLIQNVFSNFISNAIKYSPKKTKIIVGIKEKGENWLVYVEDRGEGILDKDKKKLFERFARIEKGAIKGSGLGLAISKRITEAHNGKIWVANRKGGGSVFYVLIPKVRKENVRAVKAVKKKVVKTDVKKVAVKPTVKPKKIVSKEILKGGKNEQKKYFNN